MVVYKVEKSNQTPLIEKQVSWYFLRPVLTAVLIEANILERGLVEHLEAPVI
jgi:hypothetical protein